MLYAPRSRRKTALLLPCSPKSRQHFRKNPDKLNFPQTPKGRLTHSQKKRNQRFLKGIPRRKHYYIRNTGQFRKESSLLAMHIFKGFEMIFKARKNTVTLEPHSVTLAKVYVAVRNPTFLPRLCTRHSKSLGNHSTLNARHSTTTTTVMVMIILTAETYRGLDTF